MSITKFSPIVGRWPFGDFSSTSSSVRPSSNGSLIREQKHLPRCAVTPTVELSNVEAEQSESDKRSVKHLIVGDILLVMLWGAMIPGMMWLGHAAGF